jgi:hypothetical protein
VIDETLRQILLALAAEDASVREELAADGSLFEGYHPRMEAVHVKNAGVLEAELDSGWPGIARVGEDGAEAAWRIVQHAIGLPAFQRRCLALIEQAIAQGDAPAYQAAYLTDRIRTFEGRPQLYGTQFDWDEAGQMSPQPIEDEANVDARRAGVGLPPLAEVTARHRANIAQTGQSPEDHVKRKKEFETWARKAGWRETPD